MQIRGTAQDKLRSAFAAYPVRVFLLAAIVFITTTILASQPQQNNSAITGVVVDQTGAVIVGAQVDLLRDGVTRRSLASDRAGSFRFTGLERGDYQIKLTLAGFETTFVDVTVPTVSGAPIQVVLPVATVRQETTIDANSTGTSTDSANNQSAVSASSETLQNLPVFDRDYVSFMARFLDPASVSTNGVTVIVNGVEVNGLNVAPSAIKEIKTNNDPYSAEYPRPGQGRIEIVTKPGEPKYHGNVSFTFRDSHLNARDAFAATRPPEQRRIYEGIFTGPIRQSKKTSFLISIDRNEENLQAVVFARTLAGDIHDNVPTPLRNFLISGEIDRASNPTKRWSVGYSFQERTNENQGTGGLVLRESGTNSRFREHEININQERILSPKLVNEFHLMLGHFDWPFVSTMSAPKIVVLDSFTGGGAQNDQLHTEYHFALTDVLTYSRGKHLIKTGINIPDWSRRGTDFSVNFGGTSYFSTLSDYVNNRPFSFTLSQGDPHLVFVEKVIGGFMQDQFRPRPTLLLSLGLRYDWQNCFHDANNFAPRLSFAYSPDKRQKTVIRGGAGVFYDRTGPRPMLDIQLFNGVKVKQFVVETPSFPNPSSEIGSSIAPVSVTRLDPRVHIPYLFQYGAAFERQVTKSTTFSANYLGSRQVSIFRSLDINAPLPPDYLARPNTSFGVIREIESAGRGRRDALELSLRGNVSKYFKGFVQYRLASTQNNTGGINYFPPNTYDLSDEWSRSNDDRRHQFNLAGNLEAGKLFKLGIVFSANSGAPYTMTTGQDDFHTGTANARPPGVRRNSLLGSGNADLDLRWSRDLFFTNKKRDKGPMMTIGIEAFNVLNHVNFTSFVGNLSSPFFGQPITAAPARRIQASANFKF